MFITVNLKKYETQEMNRTSLPSLGFMANLARFPFSFTSVILKQGQGA